MTDLPYFEQIGDRGFYRPTGTVSFEQAVEMGAHAMTHARKRGCSDLIINVRGLGGFDSPDVFGRYHLAVRWAESAGNKLRVAIVAPEQFFDPGKIAALMAQNRGVMGDAFTLEADAIAWLDSSARPT
jgi:hypothetical protein